MEKKSANSGEKPNANTEPKRKRPKQNESKKTQNSTYHTETLKRNTLRKSYGNHRNQKFQSTISKPLPKKAT